jgi:hypothetical protein
MPALALPTLLLGLAAAAPAAPAPGDPLAALGAALERLAATSPVQARLEQRVRFLGGEGAAARPEGAAEGAVSAGPDGLALRWPRALLAQATEEERRAAADGEAPTPARDGLRSVDPLELAAMLDAAAALRTALTGATVLEDRPDQLDGAPARLLVLKLRVELKKRDRKYVKEAESTMRLWLGEDGLPRASEAVATLRGRAFLVIGFSAEQRERHRYARVGDRLVAVEREREEKSEGGGEKGGRRLVTRLALLP